MNTLYMERIEKYPLYNNTSDGMHPISELSKQLNGHFNWNKAKMDCFARMLIGLLKTRNIKLTEITIGFVSDAQPGSCYRRVQRFTHSYRVDFDSVAWFVTALFGFIDRPCRQRRSPPNRPT
jgi:hypothetical protein